MQDLAILLYFENNKAIVPLQYSFSAHNFDPS